MALKNNEHLKEAEYTVEYSRQLRGAATEMPKTTVMYTQGQFNSIYKYDNNITISQAIPNPLVFANQRKLSTAQIKSNTYKSEATRADLIYQVKTAYYSLLFSNAMHELILSEDSIYDSFFKSVSEKYARGNGSLLEKTNAETQVMETKNEVIESEEDINNFQIQLQTLMNTTTGINAVTTNFMDSYLTVNLDSGSNSAHPLLKYYKEQIEVSERIRSVEASKALPDFVVSYFNQSIYGPANIFGYDYFLTKKNRLQGFQVGIAFPLWFYPNRAKIKAAKVQARLAEEEYNCNENLIDGQHRQAVTMYLKYRNSIAYYKENVLPSIELIFREAMRSYNAKEITYIDYLQMVSHAIGIKRNYLKVIHQNNMYALNIEYLLSR
jgi:cobalt-zinc-cadmium resistance protein CzcA